MLSRARNWAIPPYPPNASVNKASILIDFYQTNYKWTSPSLSNFSLLILYDPLISTALWGWFSKVSWWFSSLGLLSLLNLLRPR
jgi:hypothetical protein